MKGAVEEIPDRRLDEGPADEAIYREEE